MTTNGELADSLLMSIFDDLIPTEVIVRDFSHEEKLHLVNLDNRVPGFPERLSWKYAIEYKNRNIKFFFPVNPLCCPKECLEEIPFFPVTPVFLSRFVCVLDNRKKVVPHPPVSESTAISQNAHAKFKAPITSEPEEYHDVIPLETYNIPEKARPYVEHRYDARVYDLTVLLKSCNIPNEWVGTIHIPGDGAGCGYRACANAGFLKFDVIATDPSAVMRGIAREKGNIVTQGSCTDSLSRIKKYDLVIVSHILDYEPNYLADVLRLGAYVLVYERKSLYNGFGRLRPTGHAKSYQTATNYPGFSYNGAPISISHRNLAFSQTLDMYTLMKYTNFVFHGHSTISLVPYVRAMDYNGSYGYSLVGYKDAISVATQYNLFTMTQPHAHTLHIFCDEIDTLEDLPDDANLYSMKLQMELTTGVLHELFGFAGTVPLSLVRAVCGTYKVIGSLNGKIKDGLYYPLENHCSNARVNFSYVMRGSDTKGFSCVPVGTAAIYGGHADYSSYFASIPITGTEEFKLIRFKRECNASVELTCHHPALNVGKRHTHVFAVRSKSRVCFQPSACVVSLLKTYGLPKLFKLSFLAKKLSKFSVEDWRDAVEGFVNYHVVHKQLIMINHEWVFYPEGIDTYARCLEFCVKPIEEIMSLTYDYRRDLLKWLLPKIASIARLPPEATYSSVAAFESVNLDGFEFGRPDLPALSDTV